MSKGIDLSVHNGRIDWDQVKNSGGVDFVLLRAGYGRVPSQKDSNFESYYADCKKRRIPVGAYWYSYATTPDEARLEAKACLECIKGKQFEYPIFFDQEEKTQFNTGKANCSAMIRAFCEVMEQAGYWVGLYTSRSALCTYVEDDIKTRYALWIAEWNNKLNYDGVVGIWQNSSTGHIAGISGNVDLDICYEDYPTLMKKAGKNGYKATETPVPSEPSNSSDKEHSVTLEMDGTTYKGTVKEI